MSTRVTRRSAANAPSLLATDKKVDNAYNQPVSANGSEQPKIEVAKKEQTPTSVPKKRKRGAPAPKVEDDPDELPHNMGKRPAAKKVKIKDEVAREDEASAKTGVPTESTAGKQPAAKKVKIKDEVAREDEASAKTGVPTESTAKKTKRKVAQSMVEAASTVDASEESQKKKGKKVDQFPCSDPYPDWAHPTAEECLVVHDLLMSAFPEDQHSRFIKPDTVPPPSEFVAGCGEVPTILDAMLRTLLSAATSKRNSSSAFQGLVARFGLQESGPCKGSVDWTAIRHATLDDVFQAIKTGGLAKNKSQNMKAILDMVYSENEERCKAHAKVIEDDDPSAAPDGADPSNLAQMKGEMDLFNQDILTLDYYHLLTKDDALMAMQKYPGIGVKTAACVALFCMQKPCFAVDTHVFRLCRYLGWVPPKDGEVAPGEKKRPEVNEVNTFKHCEVRIPENLKYGLHQLFWNHGNHCGRCRAITGETSEGWADANCPIEHLVKRYGEKKGGLATPMKKGGKAPKVKGAKRLDSDGDDEDTVDLGDEEMESGEDVNDEDDYSPAKAHKKSNASPAKPPAKRGKVVKTNGSAKAATAKQAKAGKVGEAARVARAVKGKASGDKSGKEGVTAKKAVEEDEGTETAIDAEMDDEH